jgi:hypothetical protein
MAIESAADLAAMFDVDAFAEAATYRPLREAPFACVVIVDRGDGAQALGAIEVRRADATLHIRVAEVARPRPGDAVAIGAEVFIIQGEPLRDLAGAIWRCDARREE